MPSPPKDPNTRYYLKKFEASFRQIDDSSWIIFNKAILKRLPLSDTQTLPSDYVDEANGFLYRVRELEDHEERPKETKEIPDDGPVHPEYRAWQVDRAQYAIGSAGRLKICTARSPDAAREHENLAYAASKNPSFRIPRAVYHAEDGDGRYAILVEAAGHGLDDPKLPCPSSRGTDYARIRDRMLDALVEMARWEAPKFGGVQGKEVTYQVFDSYLPAAAWKDALSEEEVRKAREVRGILPDHSSSSSPAADPKSVRSYRECIEEHLGEKGFDMSRFAFFNSEIHKCSIAVDKDYNFLGFNDWAHCAFVPRGYIMPYVLAVSWYFCPAECNLVRQNHAAMVGIRLSSCGLPEELQSFNACLLDAKSETLGFKVSHPWRDLNMALDGITKPLNPMLRVTEKQYKIWGR